MSENQQKLYNIILSTVRTNAGDMSIRSAREVLHYVYDVLGMACSEAKMEVIDSLLEKRVLKPKEDK